MNEFQKKQERLQNPKLRTKRERRKKLTIIKDTLHRGLGKKVFTGMGEKKPLICDICKEKIYKCISEVIKSKIYCFCDKSKCKEEIEKIRRS
jgi:hypothetical protein